MKLQDVVDAWDAAGPATIHPTREHESETAYWASGADQARTIAGVLPAGARVLDFGAGDGRVAIPLRAMGYDVTAVDSSPRRLSALADRDPGLTAFQSDGSDLSKHLGRRKMDAVYCLAVLIHHGYDDGRALIGALAKTVRKGGLLILDWPTSDRPHERTDWIDITTWSADRQTAVANELGLTRVETGLPWSTWTT
ncbi:class I SAM-dependent methyltransferase [Streptomyces sp. LRE541]|uniref:class I SAM-dependent methyltransferase n=1 Tax=Streptomyces sp. LRE541 TaxID=2931983 RepID=UPI00200D78A8|nr:class I SAM-dependent methyltransferase [Streptomyces sp. LRE541]UPZ27643.1 class I SAM-dependent methyltransferase [Streptomyces sp. LRE541]